MRISGGGVLVIAPMDKTRVSIDVVVGATGGLSSAVLRVTQ